MGLTTTNFDERFDDISAQIKSAQKAIANLRSELYKIRMSLNPKVFDSREEGS